MSTGTKIYRLGDYLVHNRIISKDQLTYALRHQRTSGQPLGIVLSELGLANEEVITDQLMNMVPEDFLPDIEEEQEKSFTELETNVDTEVLGIFKVSFCMKNKIMPICMDNKGTTLILAMQDPHDLTVAQEIGFICDYNIKPVKVRREVLQRLWSMFLVNKVESEEEDRLVTQVGLQGMVPRVNENTIPNFVDAILQQAVQFRASDIHIDPYEESVIIRFRIDGICHQVCEMPHKTFKQLISRIKVICSLDISETRAAQEGRMDIESMKRLKKRVDMRVAIIPTYFGERINFRILDSGSADLNIARLGLSDKTRDIFHRHLSMQNGLILVTGPTGSGKTTTLYSMLNSINDLSRNIMTIEDPVEYLIKGLNQIQVDERHDITYNKVLRYLLRHNPDVILVGEIRDRETAEMAVRAALTGHLIISTVHTNDTSTAVTRMIDLGVKPYLLGPALHLVIAQRLGRRICPSCKKLSQVPVRDMLRAGIPPSDIRGHHFYEGDGCGKCSYTGIRGVTGIFETMPVSRSIRDKIIHNATSITIRSLAINQGMVPLWQSALSHAKRGILSVYEATRVAYNI